jgi:hypothetical protein
MKKVNMGDNVYYVDESQQWHVCFNPTVKATGLVQTIGHRKDIRVLLGNHLDRLEPLMEKGIDSVAEYFAQQQWMEFEKTFS